MMNNCYFHHRVIHKIIRDKNLKIFREVWILFQRILIKCPLRRGIGLLSPVVRGRLGKGFFKLVGRIMMIGFLGRLRFVIKG